jgi:3-deoxy-manno-octulosonate cytidylyltransferase (CMP-KDO synthetase)
MNSGTERVIWTARTIRNTIDSDLIINLQADEPELKSEYIDLLIETMSSSINNETSEPAATIGTLATFSESNNDPNMVKVVVDNQWNAMYFSRSPIPYGGSNLIHIGVYGYRYDTLMNLSGEPKSTQSLASENLEQLAWLQNGHKIKVILTNHRPAGIDTREDYDMFVRRMQPPK